MINIRMVLFYGSSREWNVFPLFRKFMGAYLCFQCRNVFRFGFIANHKRRIYQHFEILCSAFANVHIYSLLEIEFCQGMKPRYVVYMKMGNKKRNGLLLGNKVI